MNTQGAATPTIGDIPVIAILDSNAFGRGITAKVLNELTALRQTGVRVTIPDIVCRELASHEWRRAEPVRNFLDVLDSQVAAFADHDALHGRVLAKLKQHGAEILNTPSKYYERALHAQIRRESPAAPKGDVTTGAVDHIIYQHAVHATSTYDAVAIVTADGALKRELAKNSAFVIFDSIRAVRSSGALNMRLDLESTLELTRKLIGPEFAESLAEALDEPVDAVVAGIGDILQVNDTDVSADLYVNHACFFVNGRRKREYGAELERMRVTFNRSSLQIVSLGQIDSDTLPEWPPSITSIEEFLSAELSMIPSVIRPVESGTPYSKARFTFKLSDRRCYKFEFDGEPFAQLDWDEYQVSAQHSFDGELIFDARTQWEIYPPGIERSSRTLTKGVLARHIVDMALKFLDDGKI